MNRACTPAGRVFYDLATGRTMLLVEEAGYTFDGWLCWLHPDGSWVSLRKATNDDRARIMACEAHRDPVANAWNAGEDRYRATVLGQTPLNTVVLVTMPRAEPTAGSGLDGSSTVRHSVRDAAHQSTAPSSLGSATPEGTDG